MCKPPSHMFASGCVWERTRFWKRTDYWVSKNYQGLQENAEPQRIPISEPKQNHNFILAHRDARRKV
ncbi:hypothetical protein DJ90_6232 [Paenibacillus macerans]|uniref:Uncharacterized protein n=1 Tax=Paenibacillus macerans TaxID=44252 RepID=A0A090XSK1_PAEMA|nr:hypothetical protein DJ90_6232 [Paenibacillus macerans]